MKQRWIVKEVSFVMLAIAHTAPSSPSGVMYSLKHVLFSLVLTRVIKRGPRSNLKKRKMVDGKGNNSNKHPCDPCASCP